MTENQNSDSQTRSGRFAWSRLRRNLGRILKDVLPPVLHQPLGLSASRCSDIRRPIMNPQTTLPDPVEYNLPVTDADLIWPGFDQTPIVMFPRQLRRHLWAMPENELMVLSSICKVLQPKKVFEFGTFTGASTLAIAANSHPDATVHTLDIPPDNRKTHRTGVGSDIPFEFEIGEAFLGTAWESKINIHLHDALQLDATPFARQMDLVFIDADHTYDFVKSDTQKALDMLKPGGVILWHDYRWDEESPECAGVTRWVNEFYQDQGSCYEVKGTRFAVYQSEPHAPMEAAA